MKQLRNLKLVSAAIAAASLIAVPTFGQIRVGQDGHSTDASNRVGSGGYNSGGTVYSNGVGSNNIIYNNVTGLSGFHGNFEHDPRSFTGYSASNVADNFIRQSAAAPTAYQAPMQGNSPTAFYGAGRAVAPPVGTERLGYTQTYVGTQYSPSNPFSLGSDITSALDIQRQQYGESTVLGVGSSSLLNASNPASQAEQNGPLGAGISADNFTGSPLYGLNGSSGSGEATDYGLPVFATPSSSSTGTSRFRAHGTEIDARRELMQQSPDVDQIQNGANPNANAQSPGALQANSLTNAIESPNSPRMNSREKNSALNTGNIAGALNTQQGMQERLTLMSPRQQSKQYNVLAQRLARLTNPQYQSIEESNRAVNRINQHNMKGSSADGGGPTSRPAGGVGAPSFIAPSAIPDANLQPLKIESLADGISAKGLHDLLESAEELMRQGKFESAIQKYNSASRVAPNNGLIPLGRANAELGAGYYYQASADLHQVFQADPALLLGQYSLKNWISDKRLQFITDELKNLSKSDPKQETPAFLLAYISYNTGRESDAAGYLKEARARAGGHDPLLSQLESRWRLGGSSSTLEGNK